MKRLSETQAWEEIADRLSMIGTTELHPGSATGLCKELSLLEDEGRIAFTTHYSMKRALYELFGNDRGGWFWPIGELGPRIFAAQLLALEGK
jgi:hypothetical protein